MADFNYADYLTNLLILQYHNKPRAKATIKACTKWFPIDLIFAVRDGFSIDTAVGKQLDIIGKYIDVDRYYTNASSQPSTLSDDDFRKLLKLKAIVNTGSGTDYGIDSALRETFGSDIRAVDDIDANGHHTMSMTYYIRDTLQDLAYAAIQKGCLPKPLGVQLNSPVFVSEEDLFGFVTYTDQTHPFKTGFKDYEDRVDTDGEMLTFDRVRDL